MTTEVPQLAELPPHPTRRDTEAVFVSKANATQAALPPMVVQLNAALQWLNARAVEVEQNTLAVTAAAATALASANNKGDWASLAGPLAVPATVTHADKVWLLTEDLTDVTAAEPGVHLAWTALVAVGVTRFRVFDTAVSMTIQARDCPRVTAPGCTIMLPPDPQLGDEWGISVMDFEDILIDPNGKTINNDPDTRYINRAYGYVQGIWNGYTWSV